MKISFNNQTILITGATRGIGKALARAFLQAEAFNVIISGTSTVCHSGLIEELTKGVTGKCHYVKLDLNDPTEEYISHCLANFSKIDICINNAGINHIENVEDLSEENLKKVINVNLIAPALITKIVANKMIKNGFGRIINISSIFGQVTKSGRLNYSSSKFGLIGQTKAAALDLAKYNILVNAICPGFIETELTQRVLGEDGIKEVKSLIPLKRLGSAEELAPPTLFLASTLNTFITGQTLTVDGGFLAT